MSSLEEQLQEHYIANGWTLSCAESCTGGSLAARLTQVAGASEYFLGGVVSYSDQFKNTVLGVSMEALESYGAVSEQTVIEMLKGVLNISGSDFGCAITGIAGPSGGTPEKPVGTVWCAVGSLEKIHVWVEQLNGERIEVIYLTVNSVIKHLLQYTK